MGDIRSRLASFSLSTSLLVMVGLSAGCGDNTPKATGGAGTSGGTGGMAGGEAGSGGEAGTGGLAGSDAGVGGLGGLGGTTDAGNTDAAIPCYTTAFTTPVPGNTNTNLSVSDDNDHNCGDGFQYTVAISSDAPDGTLVALYDANTLLRTVSVTSHVASFDVQLATGSAQALSIQYPNTSMCNVVTTVNVSCDATAPSCSITQPKISATHPDLNGVQAPAGDRTSSAGSAYQATFVVNTSAENGQPVKLAVDNAANSSAVTTQGSTVSNGTATFSVTLTPDATYEVVATCTNKNGINGTSAKATFIVDTTPPDLTVTKPSAGMFVVGGTVDVCGQTTQMDAAALMSSLGAGQSNFCVTVGSSASPTCVPMAAVNSPSCVTIPCPGAAPFSLTVQLSDAAGNPTVQTLTGITCASSHPTVQIVAPASDAPLFQDKTKHILAAGAPTGIKDQNTGMPGAQVDVVACTDMPGTAVLTVGHVGDTTLNQLGSSVTTATAVASDNCPSSLPNVARFAGVTLPESTENADGSLAAATRLVVSVTSSANSSNVGTSPADDVWVDTTAPTLSLSSPANLCGSFTQSATTVTQDLVFSTDTPLVVVDVVNGSTTTTYDTPALMSGQATFGSVGFLEGLTNVTVTASDAAGNATVLSPNPCAVTVGMAPVVSFTAPTAGAILCPANVPALTRNAACVDDNDTGTAGWQGSIAVTVTVGGQPVTTGDLVTFTLAGNSLGTANLDTNGHAQIDHITIPDGVQTILATTASITNSGVGTGSVTVTADTTPPNPPTNLNVAIIDRRKTSMQLTWTAPSDANGGSVAGYQVRYAKGPNNVPIDPSHFDDATVTTAVQYTGAPATPGQLDGLTVSPLYIENDYYFAVESVDIAGSVSTTILRSPPPGGTCTCMDQCCRAQFKVSTLAGTSGLSNEEFGFQIDGSGDVNADGLSDVLVGALNGQHAYLFLGKQGGFASVAPSATPNAPDVVFSGDSTTRAFGAGVAEIGDIDGDGKEDLAISDRRNPSRVFIYKGRDRATWLAKPAMGIGDADYVISVDSSYNGAFFGVSMARLGDFNGDQVDDFAIGADQYNGFIGRVVIVLGKAGGIGNIALPAPASTFTIDGNNTLTTPLFGYRVQGLGRLYSASSGTTLVVSAPGNTAGVAGSEGNLYAYHGQTAMDGTVTVVPGQTFAGPAHDAHIGLALTNLGPLLTSVPSIGSGNPLDTVSNPGASGNIFLFGGSSDTGPFASNLVVSQTGGGRNGIAIIGGGISGKTNAYSLIGGDSTPDVVVIPQTATKFNIMDGNDVLKLTSPADSSNAAVSVSVPTGWGQTGEDQGTLIPDVDGDSYPDFAVGNASNTIPGAVAVYW